MRKEGGQKGCRPRPKKKSNMMPLSPEHKAIVDKSYREWGGKWFKEAWVGELAERLRREVRTTSWRFRGGGTEYGGCRHHYQ